MEKGTFPGPFDIKKNPVNSCSWHNRKITIHQNLSSSALLHQYYPFYMCHPSFPVPHQAEGFASDHSMLFCF